MRSSNNEIMLEQPLERTEKKILQSSWLQRSIKKEAMSPKRAFTQRLGSPKHRSPASKTLQNPSRVFRTKYPLMTFSSEPRPGFLVSGCAHRSNGPTRHYARLNVQLKGICRRTNSIGKMRQRRRREQKNKRERERDRETERQREKERERETERQRDREKKRERERARGGERVVWDSVG